MTFDSLINNDVVVIILAIIVASYASMIRIELPEYIKTLFKNNIFRIVFLSLLLIYSFNASPHIALAVALVFVLTLYFLNYEEIKENFAHLEKFRNLRYGDEQFRNLRYENEQFNENNKKNNKLKFTV